MIRHSTDWSQKTGKEIIKDIQRVKKNIGNATKINKIKNILYPLRWVRLLKGYLLRKDMHKQYKQRTI